MAVALGAVTKAGVETVLDATAYGWGPVGAAWARLRAQSEARLEGLRSALGATGPLGPLVSPHWHQELADLLLWTAVADLGLHLALLAGRFSLHPLLTGVVSPALGLFLGLLLLPLTLYPHIQRQEERSGLCWLVVWLNLGAGLSLGHALVPMREAFRMPPLVVPGLVAGLSVALSKGRLACSRTLQLVTVAGAALSVRLLVGLYAARDGQVGWELGPGYAGVCLAYAALDVACLQLAAAHGFPPSANFLYALARLWLYALAVPVFGCCFQRPHFHHSPHP